MIRILFVCLGNICRSPMAEFLFKRYVRERGEEARFYIASAATSSEEVGNPVHRGTREKLNTLGIDCSGKRAVRLTRGDYEKYDYLIGMDDRNVRGILRIVGSDASGKVQKLLDFTERAGEEIADPWYTGDFEAAYRDITEGLDGLWRYLTESGALQQKT
ncbi:MAG: low molecular weight phosphotyrosine protein phosphatase [Butyrivibrio sp.]|nr:low molecular weight phosphotyrosine protein phosphatase [Butyrivibrio sp.]